MIVALGYMSLAFLILMGVGISVNPTAREEEKGMAFLIVGVIMTYIIFTLFGYSDGF